METLFYKSNGTKVHLTIEMIIKQNRREIEHNENILANKELPVNQSPGRVASIKKHIARCKVKLANHLDQDYINNTYIIVEEAA